VPRTTRDPPWREHIFDYRAVTFCGRPFQACSSNLLLYHSVYGVPQPQEASFLVWASPRSLAATDGITVVFSSSGYLDVSVPLVCLVRAYIFSPPSHPSTGAGFPHSDISGSKPAYGSPEHFGVRPVLRRLLAPRHPPCALPSLSTSDLRYCSSGSHSRVSPILFPEGFPSSLFAFAIQFSRNTALFPAWNPSQKPPKTTERVYSFKTEHEE
jgi:hypothetical protein